MKKFAVAIISFVFVIAAAMLLYLFFQYNQLIVADDPQTAVSSESVVSSEQPAIEVPVPQNTESANGDAIVPTVDPPVTSEPADIEDIDKPTNDTSSVAAPDKPVTPDKPNNDPPAPPADDDTPTGGETQNGKIYVPGFGWMDDPGVGSGQGEFADDMNPNGNIVGY